MFLDYRKKKGRKQRKKIINEKLNQNVLDGGLVEGKCK